jgi:hypothetical protein
MKQCIRFYLDYLSIIYIQNAIGRYIPPARLAPFKDFRNRALAKIFTSYYLGEVVRFLRFPRANIWRVPEAICGLYKTVLPAFFGNTASEPIFAVQ